MNTLGKTLVAIGVGILVFVALFFTRDFGAPSGRAGEGFATMSESITDGIGASYDIEEEIGNIAFDDGVIYLAKTKDEKIVLCYFFLNSQRTKYYLDSYYIITDVTGTQWCSNENKVKTNYKLTSEDEVIKTCDNLPVQCQEYTITLDEKETTIRLYYNRVD